MDENTFQDDAQGFSLRDTYFVIFRHIKKIMYVLLSAVFAAVIIALFFLPAKYQSETSLLVKTGRESISVDPAAVTGEQMRMRSREEEIKTETALIKNREVVERVVNELGIDFFLIEKNLQQGPAFHEFLKKIFPFAAFSPKNANSEALKLEQQKTFNNLTEELLESIEVNQVRPSSVFSVTFQWGTPQIAHDFLEKLIEVYLERRSGIHFTDNSYNFLNEKTKQFRAELEQTENDIRDFKNKSSTILIQEQQFLNQIASYQQEIRDAEAALAASQARVKVLRGQINAMPKIANAQASENLPGLAVDEIYRRLSALKIQEQELLSTFTEQSVPVQEVRRQIREIQNMLPQMVQQKGGGQGEYLSLDTRNNLQLEVITEEGNISSLQAKLAVLNDGLAKFQKNYREINDGSVALTQLERKRGALEDSYRQYAASLQQAGIDQSLKMEKISNISVTQRPTLPLSPVKTKKMIVLLAGFCCGIGGGLALAFFLESFDHTLKTPDDLKKRLQMHYLVSVPNFQDTTGLIPDISRVENLTKLPKKSHEQRYAPGNTLTVIKHFEALLHRLIFADGRRSGLPHIIAVTSARTGEGVSTIATNLAVRLSRLSQGRVLLVDMNVLAMDEPLALGPYPNLGNMLVLQQETMEGDHEASFLMDRLYMMKYSEEGKTTTDPGELYSMWRKEYEFVVLDLPAVLDNESVPTLSRMADKVILVIEAERERWQVINRAKELLEGANANIIGAILNKRNMYIPRWLYTRL